MQRLGLSRSDLPGLLIEKYAETVSSDEWNGKTEAHHELNSRRLYGEHMPTLIVVLDDGTERRIPEVTRAVENNDAVVALNEQNHVKARFALRDVRSWYVEEDQQ